MASVSFFFFCPSPHSSSCSFLPSLSFVFPTYRSTDLPPLYLFFSSRYDGQTTTPLRHSNSLWGHPRTRAVVMPAPVAAPVTVPEPRNREASWLTASLRAQQPRNPYNQGYLPNGAAPHPGGPVPGATPLLPNQGRIIQTGPIRILCIADVRGAGHLASSPPRARSTFADDAATQATSAPSTSSPSRPAPTTSSTRAISASTTTRLWSALLKSGSPWSPSLAHGLR